MGDFLRHLSEIPYNETVVPLLIDVGLICFYVRGYFRGKDDGFLAVLLDLCCLFFINFFAYRYARPVYEHLKHLCHTHASLSPVTGLLSVIRIFVLIILVLTILAYAAMKLIRPHLIKCVTHFSLTRKINQSIGGVLGVIKRLFVSYIIITLALIQARCPYLHQELSRSAIGPRLIEVIPPLHRQVTTLHKNFLQIKKERCDEMSQDELADFISFVCQYYDTGVISRKKAINIVENHMADLIIALRPEVTLKEKAIMMDIVMETDLSDGKKERVRANLVV